MFETSSSVCKNLYFTTCLAVISLVSFQQMDCSAHDQTQAWPHIPKTTTAMTPERCIIELKKLQNQGKPQEALKLLNICLRERPDVVALYYYRAQAYMQLKKYDMAIPDCNRQIKLEPGLAKPYEMRAQCYLALKDRKHAFRDFMRVVEIEPGNKFAHEQLALIYRQEGDIKNWKRELLLAKSSNRMGSSSNVSPEVLTRHEHPVSAFLQNAGEHLAHKKPGLALEEIKKAMKFTDKDFAVEHIDRGDIYVLQAQAFQQMNANDEAIGALNQVLKYQPTNNRAYYLRAQSYFEIGKYEECIADCDRAARGDKILSNTVAELRTNAKERLKRRLERR